MDDLMCPTCGQTLDRIEVIDVDMNFLTDRVEATYLYECSNPECDYWEHAKFGIDFDPYEEEILSRDPG